MTKTSFIGNAPRRAAQSSTKRRLAAALSVLTAAQIACARDIYVSPQGDNANDGAAPDPQHALRTIQAGVDRLNPGDTLLVRDGVYRETVTFPRSGTADAPITVRPYGDETVTISGCDLITGWTLHDRDKNIWKAPMPWTLGKGRDQVFAGKGAAGTEGKRLQRRKAGGAAGTEGKRLQRRKAGAAAGTKGKEIQTGENELEVLVEARFPNEPSPGLGMYVADLNPLWPTFGKFSIPDPKKAPGRIVGKLLDNFPKDYWKGALYYGVHYQGWCAQTGVIESSGPGEITVGDRTRTWWFPGRYSNYKPEEGRGMITGHMHALDRPGEWCWQDGTLYLIPKHPGRPRAVEAKRRQIAFELSGRRYIHLRGLRIRAASMRLDGSAYCTVDTCDMAYISHFIRQYSMGQVEPGRDTILSGETGIYVSGHDNAFLNCSIRISAGAGFHLRGFHHTIHNCLIDQVDYTSHYLNAITDAVSDFNNYDGRLVGGHVITFNTMRNAGRHFFNFYGNGTSRQSRDRAPMDYMATLFAHNHLYNGMLETKDAGFLTGYYSSGGTLDGLNAQVAYNVMHDSFDIFGMRIHKLGLIYLDAGTCDVDVYRNLLWAAPGTLQGGLWFNTACVDVHERDNVFYPNFTRTCAELKPADFPTGKPFRFGHDFVHPPPIPTWPPIERRRLEAEACSAQSPHVAESARARILADGDWLAFPDIDFGRPWQAVVMRFAGTAKTMNTDRSMRRPPRHRKATDPLVLEATVNDGASPEIRKQWTFIHHVLDKSWVRFDKVPLGAGYRRFRAVYGNVYPGKRWIEVRLDRADGPVVGRVDLGRTDRPRNGHVQIYAEATASVAASAQGTRNVFLVFRSADALPVGEFEYFRFERCRQDLSLAKTEVRFELRLDAPDGEKIGTLYPRDTGGATAFRRFVARLEPGRGKRVLYLSVRSAVPGPLGAVDWLSLERANPNPYRVAGIGVPPLRDAAGRMVLPAPTNRPIARPGDKYPAKPLSRARTGPRPLFPATRFLRTAPKLDGRLDDWPETPVLALRESWDGSPSTAPAPVARIGYDNDALYVAVSTPVSKPADLKIDGYVWGRTDAMEIAFQNGLTAEPGPILNVYGWPDGHWVVSRAPGTPAESAKRLGKGVAYRATVLKDRWTCEWRIPFAACEFSPDTTPLLLFNLGVRNMAADAWAIWHGTGEATWRVASGGILVFPKSLRDGRDLPKRDLALWLDAADPSTLVRDPSERVRLWRDKSGHARHAAQPNPAFRPWFVPKGLNSRPAVEFREKVRTRLELPDLSDKQVSVTVFAVFSNPVRGSQNNHDPRILAASDGKKYDYKVGLCASVPGFETGGPRQSVWVFGDRWAKKVRIGCFSPLYQTFFTGRIAEIRVYSRVLDRAERERVRAYLMQKWGLY
ncbi:MAG: carbohydrate-binding protein [Kiritimatiellaeota bacterium]|nr:carbohydrate-binding protein [Kiritimatiellota bacterium]